jgi:hypothetical protein
LIAMYANKTNQVRNPLSREIGFTFQHQMAAIARH